MMCWKAPLDPCRPDSTVMAIEGGISWKEELVSQRDAAIMLAKQLSQELVEKQRLLEGRLENAQRLCGEAEAKLGRVRREYLSKHLTLRKRVLSVVGTLALASFSSWLVCALAASQRQDPIYGFFWIPPATAVTTLLLFRTMHSEGVKLLLAP